MTHTSRLDRRCGSVASADDPGRIGLRGALQRPLRVTGLDREHRPPRAHCRVRTVKRRPDVRLIGGAGMVAAICAFSLAQPQHPRHFEAVPLFGSQSRFQAVRRCGRASQRPRQRRGRPAVGASERRRAAHHRVIAGTGRLHGPLRGGPLQVPQGERRPGQQTDQQPQRLGSLSPVAACTWGSASAPATPSSEPHGQRPADVRDRSGRRVRQGVQRPSRAHPPDRPPDSSRASAG